ncbi:MAG: putative sugar O-methyltransferase [Candidatus Aureabacteria bacterium]|nr:putative sugar O-methyltransferase [Candidatus Auribacterota bacterium]
MLEDTAHSPDIYKPTNYWAVYEKKFLPELRKLGLRDFRSRRDSVLSSFGATDLAPAFGRIDVCKSGIFNNRFTEKIPFWTKFLTLQNHLLNGILPVSSLFRLEELEELLCDFARLYGEKAGARPLDAFEASLAGNPEHVIKKGGRAYTLPILTCYLRYAYCCNHINFDDIEILVELGGGSGKQAEVIKKLHPEICLLLFDITPQLYVCEQYLRQVFPGDVVSYRDTRNMVSVPEERKGKIFIFGNWKFPILEKIKIDLFWNSAGFQEMEPEVTANYLGYVNRQSRSVFLREAMKGKELARKKGDHGVLKKTTLEDYKRGLTNFRLVDMSPSLWPVGKRSVYSDSFWKRI